MKSGFPLSTYKEEKHYLKVKTKQSKVQLDTDCNEHPKRVYLAGPEVFLANAKEIGEHKKALCRKYGFEGVFPIDIEVDTKGKTPKEVGFCISNVNEALIKSCEIVIANITPFRGPSADIGTAYEMGFAHALGKKVYAYTNDSEPFTQRTIKALNGEVSREFDGRLRDRVGMFIEENGLIDNLMIEGCVNSNSRLLVVEEAPVENRFIFLGGFEKCLVAAQKRVSP
jgi:nucleoside 2-deoxyribosyltransferase